MSDIDNLVEMAKEIAIQTRDEWIERNGRTLSERVERLLTDAEKEIIPKILGFDRDSFGRGNRWVVDHCNGRSGDSFIGKEIVGPAQTACIRIMKQALENWEPPQELLDTTRKEFEQHIKLNIRRAVQDLAAQRAREIAEKAIQEVLNST